jgi:hypothetical protein
MRCFRRRWSGRGGIAAPAVSDEHSQELQDLTDYEIE